MNLVLQTINNFHPFLVPDFVLKSVTYEKLRKNVLVVGLINFVSSGNIIHSGTMEW